MPAFGGYVISPTHDGGEKPRALILHEALNAARGTALDCSEGTVAWVENLAIARALAEVWDANECLANQFDMLRVTALLERWERILGTAPEHGWTEAERRAECAIRMAQFGSAPYRQRVLDSVNDALSPIVATVEYTSPSTSGAVIYWDGGTPNDDAPWYSTVLYLAFVLVRPSWMSDAQFDELRGRASFRLANWLPAWTSFAMTEDGSQVGKFMLDELRNLDNQRLGI